MELLAVSTSPEVLRLGRVRLLSPWRRARAAAKPGSGHHGDLHLGHGSTWSGAQAA